MYVIGFAGQTYTLREITKEEVNHGNGHTTIITNNRFIKNISHKLEKVKELYPDVEIDKKYNNRNSWKSSEEVWESDDVFRYGKYQNQKIEDCDDNYYICWYWSTIEGSHKKFVEKILTDRGYEIRKDSDNDPYIVSPSKIKKEKENAELANKSLKVFKTGKPFDLSFTKNLKADGTVFIDGVIYKFYYYKKMYYEGLEYAFPMNDIMKAFRIKNKTINVTKYDYEIIDDIITVIVKDFEVK